MVKHAPLPHFPNPVQDPVPRLPVELLDLWILPMLTAPISPPRLSLP
jgi:hypothetical protein